jgi:hypothetical protein
MVSREELEAEIERESGNKLWALLPVGLFIIALILFFNKKYLFDTTFDVRYLVFESMAFGVLLGGMVAFFLAKNYKDSIEKIRLWASWLILPMLITPILAININNLSSDTSANPQTFTFVKEDPVYLITGKTIVGRIPMVEGSKPLKPAHFITTFIKDGKEEKLKSFTELFVYKEPNSPIDVAVKKGILGFEIMVLK